MAKKKDTVAVQRPLWRRETDYANLAPGADYSDGNKAGEAAAWSFVKEAAELSQQGRFGETLQHFVFRYLEAAEQHRDEPQKSFIRGEIVGAFALLDGFVHRAANSSRHKDLTEEDLTAQAEQAQAGFFGQQWRQMWDDKKSEHARHAANTRWAKQRAQTALENAARRPA